MSKNKGGREVRKPKQQKKAKAADPALHVETAAKPKRIK
jgi:hypothetical protein